MALAGAQGDGEGLVIPGGEGEGLIGAQGAVLRAQAKGQGPGTPRFLQGLSGGLRQLGQGFQSRCPGLLQGCAVRDPGLQGGQHRVPDQELVRLVRASIALRDHPEPQQLIRQPGGGGLVHPGGPEGKEENQKEYKSEGTFHGGLLSAEKT